MCEGAAMAWVVKLEELQEGKIVSRRKVITIDRPTVIDSADDIGLGREDTNALLSSLQQILVSSQFDHDARHRGVCVTCGQSGTLKTIGAANLTRSTVASPFADFGMYVLTAVLVSRP